MDAKARITGGLALLITILLWAGAFPAISLALNDFDPIPLAAIRFALASIPMSILLIFCLQDHMRPRDIAIAIATGLIGIAAYNVLLNVGQTSVSASVAGFIIGIQPLFAAILAALFLKELITVRQRIGIAVSTIGLVVILASRSNTSASAMGILLTIAAAICSGGSFVLQRSIIGRLGLFACVPMVVMSGTIALSPWLASATIAIYDASAPSLIALLYLALGAGFVGYLTWAHALHVFGAARASSFLFLMAPVAALLDWALTNRLPSMGVLAGGTLATIGVAIGTIQFERVRDCSRHPKTRN